MNTTKLKWRLGKLPTSEEVLELVKASLITKEEAREILFSKETEEDRDKKSLESEIKFLRELAEKLSQNRTQIVEKIREVEKPYYQWNWYKPYEIWCGNGTLTLSATSGTSYVTTNNLVGASTYTNATSENFSDIKTF